MTPPHRGDRNGQDSGVHINGKKLLVCNCEKTMKLNAEALARACASDAPVIHSHLCRSQLDRFEAALATGEELLVACTQEAPLFTEVAEEAGTARPPAFVNIREQAGWCDAGQNPTAKIAALLKSASHRATPARLKSISSDGMCLVYGSGQAALETAQRLSVSLSVTLLLSDASGLELPQTMDLPLFRGTIRDIRGSFGDFSIRIDGYAPLLPSSRGGLDFAVERDGVTTRCSVILDMSGGQPLVTGPHHRDGYHRVDPGNPVGLLQAVLELAPMVGEFEKPLYVEMNGDICAHSRSKQQGCSKCLEACPAGAITSAGDHVSIDPGICGGCGSCHAVCPTGAASYAFPQQSDTIARASLMISTYIDAGGRDPVLLIHDQPHGGDVIAAIARHGKGLPANLLPFSQHAVTSFGHVEMAAALAAGAGRILLLCPPHRRDELEALATEVALLDSLADGFGIGTGRVELLVESDPDQVEAACWRETGALPLPAATFNAIGNKREIARTIFGKLRETSPAGADILPLPAGAPYGRVAIDTDACTLCMACVSVCPADAMRDTPESPELRFVEAACVQCGLCVATCPEKALKLTPRLNIAPAAMQVETLYREEPFHCIECGTPFATKSTIERISQQLAGKHHMFQGSNQSKLIQMCADCRVVSQANSENDPFAGASRPRPRTTEDYLAAEKGELSADDFLIDD